jgi:hypothetical protein
MAGDKNKAWQTHHVDKVHCIVFCPGRVTCPLLQSALNMVWESLFVQLPGSTPVGNATLVVAKMPTCNLHSPIAYTIELDNVA